MNKVVVRFDECKGCGLCVDACAQGCLKLAGKINAIGYHYAEFLGGKCSACGLCYYVCPEPGALAVHSDKERALSKKQTEGSDDAEAAIEGK